MVESALVALHCSECGTALSPDALHGTCPRCGGVLLARYDLEGARRTFHPDALSTRPRTLWRYAELLPVRDPRHRITLGEGGTPLLPAPRLARSLGLERLWLKDESRNPTGSFKARGLAVAVSRARELGTHAVALPSAGNAAAALSAYAARAGLPAYVFVPADAPPMTVRECLTYGARVFRVRGLITDCGRILRRLAPERGWTDLSTLREPYRAEGKKTMGFELVEQLGWRVPDVVVYPAGGGTGIVGMWKAFAELEGLGLLDGQRPRLVIVQPTGCAPLVRAFASGADRAMAWEEARTVAAGLRVPATIGDRLVLEAVRRSGGTAVAVDDPALLEGMELLARTEGLLVSPEAGATVAALRHLRESGWLSGGDEVVLFLTGNGLKHPELLPANEPVPVLDPDDPSSLERSVASEVERPSG
ncbi:MAG: threonine synthase [Thermomicrobium sp.]|nr:threonine synthase [Thermomicrobium sp.]MDW8060140.1 threonine synthase [Thermomicrobium sp.]